MYINKFIFGFIITALLIVSCTLGLFLWNSSSKLTKQDIEIRTTSEQLAITQRQLSDTQNQLKNTQQQLETTKKDLEQKITELLSADNSTTLGSKAPDFTLPGVDEGTITLSNFHGKKVILVFWSPNCHYCQDQAHIIQQMHTKYPDLPILNVSVNILGSVETSSIKNYMSDNGYTFSVANDTDGQVSILYSIAGVPTTYFLDSTGTIKAIQDGSFSSLKQIENMLATY